MGNLSPNKSHLVNQLYLTVTGFGFSGYELYTGNDNKNTKKYNTTIPFNTE